MIKIAIVDDEERILEAVKTCIENIPEMAGKAETDTFQGAELFLKQVKQGNSYDVVFSDIQMKGMDGIEFGTILRERYPRIYLIFLTSYSEYAVDSYTIDAYQYILKQQMEERIPQVLDSLIERIKRERKQYRLVTAVNDMHKLYYKDIIYIKKIKSSKYVEYVTVNGNYRERISLEQILQEMKDYSFILIERGYIVNIRYIIRMKGNIIYLKNNEEVIVSRARFKEVKASISRNWGK